MTTSESRRRAGEYAADAVKSGMIVGLGTGSTAVWAIWRIGDRLRRGELRDIAGVPTSEASRAEAERVGIPLLDESMPRDVDLTIDGADEVDPHFNLIKGGGGALLREKIVAQASRRRVVVVDAGKLVPVLGTRMALPIEVTAFGWQASARYLESQGSTVERRRTADGALVVTDSGHWLLDCRFGLIHDPADLENRLDRRAGIVETGLFCGLADEVVIGSDHGVEVRRREEVAP